MNIQHITAPIYTFNTGRQYTTEGQRIAWLPLLREVGTDGDSTLVAFYDVDRGVHNVVRVKGVPGDDKVLEQYDQCAYVRTVIMSHTIEDLLREAAAAEKPF